MPLLIYFYQSDRMLRRRKAAGSTLGTSQNPFKETGRTLPSFEFSNTRETCRQLNPNGLTPRHRLNYVGVFLRRAVIRRPNTHMQSMILKSNTMGWAPQERGGLRGIANSRFDRRGCNADGAE